jgi:hypothetical protein
MKMTILILLITLTLRAYAPEQRVLYVAGPEKIQPYESIWRAVCRAESNNDPFAIGDKHLKQWSYGIAQIREERLSHYNKQSGHSYSQSDLFNPAISKEIFMFYMAQFGPYRTDDGIRAWNGSGKATYDYLKNIKKLL